VCWSLYLSWTFFCVHTYLTISVLNTDLSLTYQNVTVAWVGDCVCITRLAFKVLYLIPCFPSLVYLNFI
jgi:hypothetical protein